MKLKIAIIGFGSMGQMFFEKILDSGLVPAKNFFIANRTFSKIETLSQKYDVNLCQTNAQAAKMADIIFLCIRPVDMKKVLLEIAPSLNPEKHIVSLNGSIKFSQLEQICKENKISKVIPSVTAEVNKAQMLVCHNTLVQKKDAEELCTLMKAFGNVIELPENEMGMGSELVSCMPGFIAALFKEIKNAAVPHTKIEENQISKMLVDTLLGTASLINEKGMTFEQVIERVATKGGITEVGAKIIEDKFPAIADELFEKTLEKRRQTTQKAEEAFSS